MLGLKCNLGLVLIGLRTTGLCSPFETPYVATRSYFSESISPLTCMSDQQRISPYSINTMSSRQVIRNKKNITRGLLVDPIPNFLN